MDDFLKQPTVMGSIMAFIGLLPLAGAVFNSDWLYTNPRLQRYEKLIGRNGTRAVLAMLGLALLAAGIAIASGLLEQGAFAN